MDEIPEPTHPLREDQPDRCPGCGEALRHVVAFIHSSEERDEDSYEGVQCPKGCDLWSYYG